MQDWEGRTSVNMSNSVNTEMRESIRGMAIGKTRTHEKADRATVEQVTRACDTVSIVEFTEFAGL